jgi:hypothetical protein
MAKKKPEPSDDELLLTIAGHHDGVPDRHRAQAELNRRMAERAGASTHIWTVIGTWAAIIAAVASIIALFK